MDLPKSKKKPRLRLEMPAQPHPSPGEGASSSRRPSRRDSTNAPTAPPLQFVTATNPEQFRDRSTMRQVRRGVMIDYLQRAETDPNCTDIRIVRSRNRQAAPSRSASQDSRAHSGTLTAGQSAASMSQDSFQDPALVSIHEAQMLSRRPMSVPAHNVPVFFDPAVSASDRPFLPAAQSLELSNIDIAKLKQSCAIHFGSPAMQSWYRLTRQAPEAFLSTLCICSPYLDLMDATESTVSLADSAQTLAIRQEVIRMVQRSMNDSVRRIDDLTIMTVLQLLTGDIISANTQTLHVHELGLVNMIRERGGLSRLGGQGQIASTIVITCFGLAVLHNDPPELMYTQYAQSLITLSYSPVLLTYTASAHDKPPQMPFFDFVSSETCPQAISHTMSLVKAITRVFLELHHRSDFNAQQGSSSTSRQIEQTAEDPQRRIESIAAQIHLLPTAHQTGHVGSWNWAYEACRLVALLYTHSLLNKTAFATTPSCMSINGVLEDTTDLDPGITAARIKSVLAMTDLSTCWAGMTSVLHWITLVAGSACGSYTYGSPSTQSFPHTHTHTHTQSNAESDRSVLPFASIRGFSTQSGSSTVDPLTAESISTRRWLVAVAMRCSILLCFEHTTALLCSLEQLIEVQRILRGEDTRTDAGYGDANRNDSLI